MSMRGTRFYHRRRLPSDVRRLVGKAEVWKSLDTDSLTIALRRLPAAAARIESQIEQARLSAGRTVDQTLLRPLLDDPDERPLTIPSETTAPPAAELITFDDAYRRYIDDPTRAWSPSTRETYETCRNLAVAVIGADMPVSSLSRAHCRDLLDVLRFLPTNASKRFPRLSPRQAAERARKIDDIPTISAANANSIMSNLSTFLNWAVNEEMLGRNPARGLRLPDQVAKRDKRLPFSVDQLRLIFDAPLYRGCVDGERGYAK